jgi:putative addiction module killer protein
MGIELLYYVAANGTIVFEEWVESLTDEQAESRIDARLQRLTKGNFGDHKSVGSGVWELRIHYGPGYRIYYALTGTTCVLLLCGGDKSRQFADIADAIRYWKDFQKRTKKP